MRWRVGGAVLVFVSVAPSTVWAQSASDLDVRSVEEAHRESISTRRTLAHVVLVAGSSSLVGGSALMIPNAEDLAFRFAGINTAIFGAINTVVALLALRGIGQEEAEWESGTASARRRTPDGLARARVYAALDERREATSHAINLGLGAGYLGIGTAAILASRLGVDHPNRWLGSGVAIAGQALFLLAIDYVGLRRASHFHRVFLKGLVPTIGALPSGTELQMSFRGAF